jgi:hypothetical protein
MRETLLAAPLTRKEYVLSRKSPGAAIGLFAALGRVEVGPDNIACVR